jgi:hypothetical protein
MCIRQARHHVSRALVAELRPRAKSTVALLFSDRHCVGNQTGRLGLQQYSFNGPPGTGNGENQMPIAARVLGIVALATIATQVLGEEDFPDC